MSNSSIFISYSRTNSEFALDLANKLKSSGVNVWIDQLSLKTGDNWDLGITKALKDCKTFLIILSKVSVESDNVLNEIAYAVNMKKDIIPILIEECDLPLNLIRSNYIDLLNNNSKEIEQLIAALNLDQNNAQIFRDLSIAKEAELKIPNKEEKDDIFSSRNNTANRHVGNLSFEVQLRKLLANIGRYILIFILLLMIASLLSSKSVLIPLDLFIFKSLSRHEQVENIDNRFVLFDVQGDDANQNSLKYSRKNVTDLLLKIGSLNYSSTENPVIVLNYQYSNQDPTGLNNLKSAIAKLKNEGVKIYASYYLPRPDSSESFESWDMNFEQEMYDDLFQGNRLHTEYNYYGVGSNRIVSYNPYKKILGKTFNSLTKQVLDDYNPNEVDVFSSNHESSLVTLSEIDNLFNYSYKYDNQLITPYESNNNSLDLKNKIIIIGSFEYDMIAANSQYIPGSFLIARTIGDGINKNVIGISNSYNVINDIATIFLFTLIVILMFQIIYYYIKKLRTKPLIIGIITMFLGIFLLMSYVYTRSDTFFRITPAVLSMLIAIFVTLKFTQNILVPRFIIGDNKYDVYISYAKRDRIWVKENLYKPLQEYSKPDGQKLVIFFDEGSSVFTRTFNSKYAKSIINSKLFIPVITKNYFKTSHCITEMDLALRRYSKKLNEIFPITNDSKYIPAEMHNHYFVDINEHPNFIKHVQEKFI